MADADRRPLRVTALLARMGELFVAGRLREMTAAFSFPCPIEVGGELVVMPDPEALETALARRHAQARADGLATMVPRVIAIEMPRRGRFRVWMRWRYLYADRPAEEDERASVYYMARHPGGGLSIEMMDVVPTRRTIG